MSSTGAVGSNESRLKKPSAITRPSTISFTPKPETEGKRALERCVFGHSLPFMIGSYVQAMRRHRSLARDSKKQCLMRSLCPAPSTAPTPLRQGKCAIICAKYPRVASPHPVHRQEVTAHVSIDKQVWQDEELPPPALSRSHILKNHYRSRAAVSSRSRTATTSTRSRTATTSATASQRKARIQRRTRLTV